MNCGICGGEIDFDEGVFEIDGSYVCGKCNKKFNSKTMMYQVNYTISKKDTNIHSKVIKANSKSETKRKFIQSNEPYCKIIDIEKI